MTSELTLFPGPFLYTEKVKNHSDIKNYLMPYIESLQSDELRCYDDYSKVTTSYFEQSEKGGKDLFYKVFSRDDILKDVVWNPLDNCLSELPYVSSFQPNQSTIGNAWFNYFEKGGDHSAHVHTGAFISGIYILHLEEENPTIFMGNAHNLVYYTFCCTTKNVTEGSVLLFPSQMWHRVSEVKSKRVTVSFNINSTFTQIGPA